MALDYLADPPTGRTGIGGILLDGRRLAIPAFGQEGTYQAPYYLRGPFYTNTDLAASKTFGKPEGRNVELRLALFNAFNQAFANPGLGDVILTVETSCRRFVDGACDLASGYEITN